jgi:hypothetical protein
MWQSPAIFLQHSISTFVMVDLGRHARAGVAVHTKTRTKDRMTRHFTIVMMLQPLVLLWQGCDGHLSRLQAGCPLSLGTTGENKTADIRMTCEFRR